MKNRDIIVVGLQSWDSQIGSNCINIALEFSKQNRVLYVNRALDRVSLLKHRSDPKIKNRLKTLRGETKDIENIHSNLWVLNPKVILESVNWMPEPFFSFFNKHNNKRLAQAILKAGEELGFKDTVLFIDNDFFRAQYLAEMLNAQLSIYYVRDYLLKQPYFKKHGARLEAALIKKSDVVTANSSYLAKYARQFNDNSFDIGQGCDFTYFNPQRNYPKPLDLENISHSIIGYVGALLGYRLDIELLTKLATQKSEWNWVFVGPEDEEFKKSLLHQMKNVHFLGAKPQVELAGYVSHFDVCINPQLVNEATMGNYPRKVDEYLAMGKPVVATFTEFMTAFSEFTYLCNTAEEYIEAISMSLNEENSQQAGEKRREFALSHSWENSVAKLYEACQSKMEVQ